MEQRPRALLLFVFGCSCAVSACSGTGDEEEPAPAITSTDGGADATTSAWDAASEGDAGAPREVDAGDEAAPCPDGMALVEVEAGAVCVDRYEGALLRREADGGEAPWPWYLPIDALDAGEVRAVPARGVFPQAYVSEVQAMDACRASGKRLCTLGEWTAACRGRPAHDFVYPYGDTYEPGACNEGKRSPIDVLFGPTPTYSDAELNDPRCDQLDGGLAKGGAYAKCVSAYGTYDMHGNLHEWIDDTPDAEAPDRGSFMGGYFVDAKENGPGCTYRTTAHAKTYHDYSTGFRCCADPRGG